MKVLDSAGFKTALTKINEKLNKMNEKLNKINENKDANKDNEVVSYVNNVRVEGVNRHDEPIKLKLKFVKYGTFVDLYFTLSYFGGADNFIDSEKIPSAFKPKNSVVTNVVFDEWSARLIRLFFDGRNWLYVSASLSANMGTMIEPYEELSVQGHPAGDGWMFLTRYEVN